MRPSSSDRVQMTYSSLSFGDLQIVVINLWFNLNQLFFHSQFGIHNENTNFWCLCYICISQILGCYLLMVQGKLVVIKEISKIATNIKKENKRKTEYEKYFSI